MSLLVWYPLQGNTNNYGTLGSELNPTSSGVTYATGKLGQCLNRGSLRWTAEQTAKAFHRTTSIAFWLKPIQGSGSAPIIGNDNMGADTGRRKYSFWQWDAWNVLHYTWQHDDSGSAFFGGTITLDENWHHIVGIQDEAAGTCSIYVDGVRRAHASHDIKNMSFNYAWPTTIIHDTALNNICDFRVYDHALSVKEIKELAKGLVLHYTFDNPSFENTTNVSTVDGWSTYSSYWTISERTETGLKLYRHTGSTSDCVAVQNSAVTSKMAQNDIWTFSCYLYKNGQPWKSTASGISSESYGYKTVSWESREDGYYRITFQVISSPGTWVLHNYFFSPINIGVDCEMRYMQFEKKDHATPYTKTSRVGIIGDSSGLGNDGILVLPEYYNFTQDSILGTGALYSAGDEYGNAYIQTKLNPSFINGTGTICFWYKKNVGSSGFLVATPDPGSQTHYLWANSPGGAPWNGGGASYSHWYIDGEYNKTPISDTDWHFYCIAGVNISNWSSFAIQKHGDGSWLYRGKIADFRVYNTVLDADEVQAMYKTRWAANKQGQVFSNTLNEGQSKFQITRNGVNNCLNIQEAGIVPADYQPLHYIYSSSRSRCINTDATFNLNTDKVEIDFQSADATGNYFIAGCGTSGTSSPYLWIYQYTSGSTFSIYADTGSGQKAWHSGNRQDANRHIVTLDKKILYYDGTIRVDNSSITFADNLNKFCLFDSCVAGSGYSAKVKIYSCKIWHSDVLVRNLIPVRRKSDEALGFFDTVSGRFFGECSNRSLAGGPAAVGASKQGQIYVGEFSEI